MSTDETKSRRRSDKKSRKLDQFLQALLAHSTVEAAAKAAGISRATAFRWMADPAVVQRLTEARRENMKAVMAKLRLAAGEAVDCLCEVQRDGESESARVSAARCILEQTMRAAEMQDLQERIAALEQIAKSPHWKGAGNDRETQPPGRPPGTVNGAA